MTNSMAQWTKQAAQEQMKLAQKRYNNWKLEVIQNPNDNSKREILNNTEKDLLRYTKIFLSF